VRLLVPLLEFNLFEGPGLRGLWHGDTSSDDGARFHPRRAGEELRKVLGLESVKDADENVIQESSLPIWANFRQRALDVAITEINAKMRVGFVVGRVGSSAR